MFVKETMGNTKSATCYITHFLDCYFTVNCTADVTKKAASAGDCVIRGAPASQPRLDVMKKLKVAHTMSQFCSIQYHYWLRFIEKNDHYRSKSLRYSDYDIHISNVCHVVDWMHCWNITCWQIAIQFNCHFNHCRSILTSIQWKKLL